MMKKSTHNLFEFIPNKDNYCIKIKVPIVLEIPKTESNRKLLAVFLRLIFFACCENLFTFQEIANILGFNDRRDIDNYYREFKKKGYDFLGLLTRKVDLSKYVDIIQKIVIDNPFLTVPELFLIFKGKFPLVKMCAVSFNKYLSQANTCLILQSIHKNISKKGNYWDKNHLFSYLLKNNENPVVKKRIEEMKESEIETKPEKVSVKIKLSTQTKSFLVKFLVGASMSYQMIAFIMGMSKSNVRKLVYRDPYFYQLLLSSIVRYSGIISVDEKYVKLNGVFLYVFSAVDDKTGIPLMVQLYPQKNADSWKIFFTLFKKHYGNPSLIISDGCPSLAKGRKEVFPKVSFQYCKFHKMKNLIKNIYQSEKDIKLIKKIINKLKQVFNRQTVGARRKALLELEKMITGTAKEYFISSFMGQWKHLTKSYTSNAAERWNKKIDKVISGKYGLKTPETIEQLVHCLWFRELITNGKVHLDSKSIISTINIPKFSQEMIEINHMEQLFDIKAYRKVA